jgi:hypothetical protein
MIMTITKGIQRIRTMRSMQNLNSLDITNVIFCDVTLCGSRKNRRFGGKYPLHHQGDKNQRARNNVSSN